MAEETSDIMAARERMIAKRFGGANATRTGGVRRKKKNVHKTATSGKCCFFAGLLLNRTYHASLSLQCLDSSLLTVPTPSRIEKLAVSVRDRHVYFHVFTAAFDVYVSLAYKQTQVLCALIRANSLGKKTPLYNTCRDLVVRCLLPPYSAYLLSVYTRYDIYVCL